MLAPRDENGFTLLGELPAADGLEKVEVQSRTDAEGNSVLELVEYRWGSGLGWYVQKRISLDCGQAEALRAILGAHAATSTAAAPPAPRLKRPAPARTQEGNVIRLDFAS